MGEDSYTSVFNNLSAFSLYAVEISAETRAGEGQRTNPVFVTTDPSSASPPSFVAVDVLNSTTLQLRWGYPTIPRGNISGYIIFHNITLASDGDLNQFNITLMVKGDSSNQSYVFAGLAPFTDYQFQVSAFTVSDRVHIGRPNEKPVVERTDEDRESP